MSVNSAIEQMILGYIVGTTYSVPSADMRAAAQREEET
jgi:hypothetical protein